MFEKPAKALGGAGVLTEKDLKDFSVACHKIVELMSDGRWHSKQEMRDVTGQDAALRRFETLKDYGYILESERVTEDHRLWRYRIVGKNSTNPS